MFHRIQQGRFHLHIVSVCISLQNSANLSSALMLFNVLMDIAAGIDLQQQKATFFADTHTQAISMLEQIATQHQANYELELLVLHEFEPSFR